MNLKSYKKFIIVDEDNKPMAFSGDQLCYCHNQKAPVQFALQAYPLKTAQALIKKTIAFRRRHGFSIGKYYLMPIGKKSK